MAQTMGPGLEQGIVSRLTDAPKDVWILLKSSVRYHYIERNLRGEKKITAEEVARILNSAYGLSITDASLNNHLSKWKYWRKGLGPSNAAGALPPQTEKSVGKRVLQRKPSQNSIPGTITAAIELRRNRVVQYVQAVVDSEFGRQALKYPNARKFDIMWLKPGDDYSTRWKELRDKSSSLIGLAESGRLQAFQKTLGEIFGDVESAILGDKEVNIMVSLWRICGDFQNASVRSHNQNLVRELFQSIWIVRYAQYPYTDPLMQLCEVIVQSDLDELRPLLGFGYERAIHCLKNYFEPNNFTIPQMTTDFLKFWNGTQTLFPDLTGDFEALIAYADRSRGPSDWCSLVCLHQFLDYAVKIEHNEQRGMLIARNLYPRAHGILSRLLSDRRTLKWDSVARGFTLSATVLISWYRDRDRDMDKANDVSTYVTAVKDILSNGDEECMRQAIIFGCQYDESIVVP